MTVIYQNTVAGYLLDNRGGLHSMTVTAADALIGNVEPVSESATDKKASNALPLWAVDEGGEAYYTAAHGSINDCVFRAVRTYLESMSLGTLTTGDKYFFEDHPRVNSDGVNNANVLCVAQGLIVPWGLGITRVFVPTGSAIGEQHREFAAALGINPVAVTDNKTSNEDFIATLGLAPDSNEAAMIRETMRFEFVETPPAPCVVMLSNWTGKSTTPTKPGAANVGGKWSKTKGKAGAMGHADFIGPRDKLHGEWRVAFQIGRLPQYTEGTDINRYADVEAFGEEEIHQKFLSRQKFSVWSSKIGGKTITEWQAENRKHVVTGTVPAASGRPPANGGVVPHTKGLSVKNDDMEVEVYSRASDLNCPECGGPTGLIRDYNYCLDCNWFNDINAVYCPFCFSDFTDKECTAGCGYDSEWMESALFMCSEHKEPLYFKHTNKHTKKTSEPYIYACPDCVYVGNMSLSDIFKEGISHTHYMDIPTAVEQGVTL